MRYGKTVEAKYARAYAQAGMPALPGTPDEVQVAINRWYARRNEGMKNRFGK